MELWGVELRPESGRWVLRLLVDKEGGVTIDDLARVSREAGDLLDVYDPLPWRYDLEVSSPGVSRPLFRPEHYRSYVGKRVRVRTSTPVEGQRVFSGVLLDVGADAVRVDEGGGRVVSMPFSLIAKATYEHDFSSEKGAPTRRPASRAGKRAPR